MTQIFTPQDDPFVAGMEAGIDLIGKLLSAREPQVEMAPDDAEDEDGYPNLLKISYKDQDTYRIIDGNRVFLTEAASHNGVNVLVWQLAVGRENEQEVRDYGWRTLDPNHIRLLDAVR